VAADIAEGFGVIVIIGKVFAFYIALIASFLDVVRFFIICLFFEQLGLLGLNSK
jgi:hypothetical protein